MRVILRPFHLVIGIPRVAVLYARPVRVHRRKNYLFFNVVPAERLKSLQRFIWMRLFSTDGCGLDRTNLILAPHSVDAGLFTTTVTDCSTHAHRLAEAQKLRGEVAVEVGAVDRSQLTEDGRHIQSADEHSWHLLTLDTDGRVAACARYTPHANDAQFEDLAVSESTLAKCDRWGLALRRVVEEDLRQARRRGCSYVELGGWVMAQALRCTSEALKTLTTAYAFAQLCGGDLGITTATTRSCSAAILKRMGCERLRHCGAELPVYFDERYHQELEVLRFDALRPNPKYRKWIDACRAHLPHVPVICRGTADGRERIESYLRRPMNTFAIRPRLAT